MPAIALSALTNLLKIQYPNGLEVAAALQSPLVGRMPKGKFVGSAVSTKVKLSPGQKASSTFATIQTATVGRFGASTVVEFLNSVNYRHYALFQLETDAISRSEGNAAGVRSYVKSETDSALEDIGGQLATGMYGDGSGIVGISAGVTTTALQLETIEDVINFEVGQVIDYSTTLDGSGALGGQPTIITRVDRELGILYAGANWNAGFSAGRGLYRAGNYGNQPHGLGAWLPASTVDLSVAFLNVTRNVDNVRLAGNRYTSSGDDGTYLRCFSNALSRAQRAIKSAKPDEFFVNPYVFDRVISEMNDRTEYVKMPGKTVSGTPVAQYGYEGVKISVGDASATLFKDVKCQRDTAWLLQMDTWEALVVPGGFPRVLEGGDGLTVTDADASEFRFAAYWDMRCFAPGKNCRVDLSYLNSL